MSHAWSGQMLCPRTSLTLLFPVSPTTNRGAYHGDIVGGTCRGIYPGGALVQPSGYDRSVDACWRRRGLANTCTTWSTTVSS